MSVAKPASVSDMLALKIAFFNKLEQTTCVTLHCVFGKGVILIKKHNILFCYLFASFQCNNVSHLIIINDSVDWIGIECDAMWKETGQVDRTGLS